MLQWNSDNELFSIMKEVLYTAVLGDILDQKGYRHQFLPPEIRPLDSKMVMAGRAMPVLERDIAAEDGSSDASQAPFGLMLDALDSLKENEIYLCSGSSPAYALIGEIMSARAQYLGAAGLVANGYIRDTRGILKLGIACFAHGSYAQDQAPRGVVTAYRVPIQVGDVTVEPGDILFGDCDGVLAIPRSIERQVIALAYEKATGEKTVLNAIRSGAAAKKAFADYGIM